MSSNRRAENEARLAWLKKEVERHSQLKAGCAAEAERLLKVCRDADFWTLPFPYENYARNHGYLKARIEELEQTLGRLNAEIAELEDTIAEEEKEQQRGSKRRRIKR